MCTDATSQVGRAIVEVWEDKIDVAVLGIKLDRFLTGLKHCCLYGSNALKVVM